MSKKSQQGSDIQISKTRGLTLIEMLVVIAIIAASVILGSTAGLTKNKDRVIANKATAELFGFINDVKLLNFLGKQYQGSTVTRSEFTIYPGLYDPDTSYEVRHYLEGGPAGGTIDTLPRIIKIVNKSLFDIENVHLCPVDSAGSSYIETATGTVITFENGDITFSNENVSFEVPKILITTIYRTYTRVISLDARTGVGYVGRVVAGGPSISCTNF